MTQLLARVKVKDEWYSVLHGTTSPATCPAALSSRRQARNFPSRRSDQNCHFGFSTVLLGVVAGFAAPLAAGEEVTAVDCELLTGEELSPRAGNVQVAEASTTGAASASSDSSNTTSASLTCAPPTGPGGASSCVGGMPNRLLLP